MLVLVLIAALVVALIVTDWVLGRRGANWIAVPPSPDRWVIAHRGGSRHAPENTLASFAKGHEQGARAVECDVVFTADGVPVVSHHLDLSERVAVGFRPAVISRMRLEEVQRLDVGSWFSPEFAGERVPTLAEALGFFTSRFERIYLHDKHDDDLAAPSVERVAVMADVIREAGLVDRVRVMVRSGNLEPWREAAPGISLIQSRNGPDGRRGRIPLNVSYAAGMRHLVVYASPGSLTRSGRALAKLGLRNLGWLVGFWPAKALVDEYRAKGASFVVFTVNDAFRARLYARAGFEAMGTDDPQLVSRAIGQVEPLRGSW